MKDLHLVSEQTNLDLIEITTGRNGYPSGLYKALDASNLENFKEVQEIAEKHDLDIVKVHQRDGWSLWENQGWANEPFKNSSDDFGDNYTEFYKMTETEFFENEIHPLIAEIEDFETLEKLLESKKEVWEEIENMEDDEFVVTHEGYYYETLKKESLSFYHDTHNYKIALVLK